MTMTATKPKKELTEEQKQRMAAAGAEYRAEINELRSEVLTIGQHQIFRYDLDNVALRKGDDGDLYYYPSIVWALKALLHREVTDAQAKSIREVLAAVKAVEAKIDGMVL